MSRLDHRISKIERVSFGRPGTLTMTEYWISSDEAPDAFVTFVSVFGGGKSAAINRANHGDDRQFWSAVEEAHLRIHGRPVAAGKSYKFRTHFEGKP